MRSLKTFGSGMPTIEPSILRTALLVQRCMSTGVWNVTFTGSCSRVLRSLASASEAARDTSACGIMTTGSCFFFPNAIVVLLLVGTKVPIVLIPRITTTFVDYTELLVAGHFSLGEALEEFLELLSGEALPMRSLMTHYFGGLGHEGAAVASARCAHRTRSQQSAATTVAWCAGCPPHPRRARCVRPWGRACSLC